MKKSLSFLAGLLIASHSLAAFVHTDWQTSGDELLTLDDSTHLAWLNVSVTSGWSSFELFEALANNPNFAGFRLASSNEVGGLMDRIFVGGYPAPGTSNGYEQSVAFMDVVGYTRNYGGGSYELEALAAPDGDDHDFTLTTLHASCDEDSDCFGFLADAQNAVRVSADGHVSDASGYVLVREAPLPASFWLFGSALLALRAIGRRA